MQKIRNDVNVEAVHTHTHTHTNDLENKIKNYIDIKRQVNL